MTARRKVSYVLLAILLAAGAVDAEKHRAWLAFGVLTVFVWLLAVVAFEEH